MAVVERKDVAMIEAKGGGGAWRACSGRTGERGGRGVWRQQQWEDVARVEESKQERQ